jgi:hypothetical protein
MAESVLPQISTRNPVAWTSDGNLAESSVGCSLLPDFLVPFSYFLYFPSFLFPSPAEAEHLLSFSYTQAPLSLFRENERSPISKIHFSITNMSDCSVGFFSFVVLIKAL